jgi:tetratricopeptide (TPR) repeat protein
MTDTAHTSIAGDKVAGDKIAGDKIVHITNNIVQQAQAAKERQPLRVLAVIASPVAGQREADPPPAALSGRAEWKALRAAVKVTPMLLARLRPPTALALRSICAPSNAGAFNVAHFICHGLSGALALEDERGLMKVVSAIDLAEAIKEGGIQMAVINACYSAAGHEESIAQALVDAGVRSVVAHRWPLIDPAAVLFSQALYRELAAGRSLRAAFDEAVKETTAQYTAEKGNAVLLGDEALAFPRPSGEVEPSRVIEGAALPDEAARFFGRGKELIELADVFAHADLRGAALTGIGGIGKSALAFEAADRLAWHFDDRVAYVRASEFGFKAEDALNELARGLGIEVRSNAASELRNFVNRQSCLLLFDNMERAGSELYRLADFVSSLNLDAGSQVLFTLRPPLSTDFKGLHEINLHEGLDENNAIEYARFVARIETDVSQWQNLNEARALVRRVAGHPHLIWYAIHLSKEMSFADTHQIVMTLSDEMDVALQKMIGLLVDAAGAQARTALARLAIFPQPRMIVEAAKAACGDAAQGLRALVKNGVLALERDTAERYALHATVIDWIKVHGAASEAQLQEARQRAVKAYSELADAHANEYNIYAGEHDNYMTALDWAWTNEMWAEVSSMAQGVVGYLRLKGYWQDGINWMKRAVEARRKLPESDENKKQLAYHLDSLGRFFGDTGNIDEALQCLKESARLLEEANDESGLSTVNSVVAGLLVTRGDLNGAMALYQQSLDLKERLGDLQGKSATLGQMANVFMAQDEWEEAKRVLLEAIDIEKRIGDATIGYEIAQLGQIAEHDMELEEAARLYRESIGYFEKLGSPVAEQVRGMLADVLRQMGEG